MTRPAGQTAPSTDVRVSALPTPAQRPWLELLHGTGTEARNVVGCDVPHDLSLPRLRESLARLVGRHDVLRLYYPTDGPRLAEPWQPAVEEVDLPADGPRRVRHLEGLYAELLARPPVSAERPSLTALVGRVDGRPSHLALAAPALNADARSLRRLLQELTAAATTEVPLPEAGVRFLDVSGWLGATVPPAATEFWGRHRRGVPKGPELPLDRSATSSGVPPAGRLPWDVGALLGPTASALDGDRRVLHKVLTAAAAWVARICDVRSVPLELVIDGREDEELAEVVGPFEMRMPVALELGDAVSLGALERRAAALLDELKPWQEWFRPAGRDVSDSDPRPGRDAAPLCVEVRRWRAHSGARLQGFQFRTSNHRSPLRLVFDVTEEGVDAALEYDAASWSEAAALCARRQLTGWLRLAVDTPEEAVDTAEIDPGGSFLAAPSAAPSPGVSVIGLFERAAWERPDAVAAVEGDRHFSYHCLDTVASELAVRVREQAPKAGFEARIAVRMRTSCEALAAILAVGKTGSAYVPIDPAWPRSRQEAVLADASVLALLVAEDDVGPRPSGLPVVPVVPPPHRETRAVRVRSAPAESEGLAYVLYTSGTSGAPKGVMVTQAGLANYVAWAAEAYQIADSRGAAVQSPLTFDFTLTGLLGPLAVGRTVYFCAGAHPLDEMAEVLARMDEIGVVKLTPTAVDPLRRLLEQNGAACRVRRLVLGGEALVASKALSRLAGRLGALVVNEYGPTETVVGSSVHESAVDSLEGAVPIGTAIAGTTLHLSRADGRPVEAWVEGELAIGGRGVARGYLGRPATTASAFVPAADPGAAPGGRVYRTGDRARRRADGNLVYLGRRDGQVKIRGFRVELTEIEEAMRACPGVADAVAGAVEGPGGHLQVVAGVVPDDPAALTVETLRAHVRSALPEYAQPSVVHLLASLPTTANGKLDLEALRALPAVKDARSPRGAPAGDGIERTLQRLWCELLGRQEIGFDENFFEIGGDSILSIQFLARAHQEGIRLRPRDLEKQATIVALAAVARSARAPSAPPPSQAERAVPPAPIQAWFLESRHPAPGHYNQSVLLRTDGTVSAAQVERAVTSVVEHHSALRHVFVMRGESFVQLLRPEPERPFFTRVDGSGLDEAAWRRRVAEAAGDAQRAIDLGRAPLLQAVLLVHPERDETLLYLVVHHLVVDHLSWPVLLGDLRAALSRPEAAAVAALSPTTPYAEWAERTAARAAQGLSPAEKDYWLSDRWQASASVAAAPFGSVADEESVSVALGAAETTALLGDANAAYHTRPLDLLLTAWALAWSDWTGARALSIDLEGHGRDDGDVSRTVGWFTALFPVYLAVTRPSDVGRAVREIKEALRAVPGDGSGYGRARYLHRDAETRRALAGIQSGVAFNYLGDVEELAAAGGLHGGWTLVPTIPAPNRGPGNHRTHGLEVGAHVRGGSLRLAITFALRDRSSIQALADAWVRRLKEVVAHAAGVGRARYTPSDFPSSGLGQEPLDDLTLAHPDLADVYRLSHTQKGLLFHFSRESTGGSYVVQLRLAVTGALDEPLFRDAWARVVARHAILRTSFTWESVPEPVQVVHRRVGPSFAVEDWRSEEPSTQALRLDAWLAADRERGIDLREAPLHRIALFRLGDERWEVVWTYHHILLDGWSTSNVLREVMTAYAAARSGQQPVLPPAHPYRDYVEWLEDRLGRETGEELRGRLREVAAGTALGLSRPRDARRAGFGSCARALSLDETERLHALAREAKVTPNVVLQAAWALTVGRYARSDQVIFGVTSSGRPFDLPGVEERVGLYLSTLPLCVRLDPRHTVGALLDTVGERLGELLRLDHLPLADAQAACRLPEGESLFDSIVVFENFPAVRGLGPLEGVLDVRVVSSSEETNYPLTLIASLLDGVLSLKASFDRRRFEDGDVERLLAHLHRTLVDLGRGPQQRAYDCGLSPEPAEPDHADEGRRRPLHRIFEAQVAAAPEAVAVVEEDGQISYGALDRRANAVAARLAAAGVRPGDHVLLCMERSANLLAALLGILKAGAAYVPADSRFPPRRLAALAERCPFAVADATTAPAIPEGCRVADVDVPGFFSEDLPPRPAVPDDPDAVAYLMHTSGSSGTPKGTLVTHRNVARLFSSTEGLFDFRQGDAWSFFHSIAFDFSVWEIFGALLTGGRVVVTPHWIARSPDRFADLLRREDVAVLSQTPSAFQQLLTIGNLLDRARSTAIRWVVFGGEAFRPDAIRDAFVELGRRDMRLVNMYGITETTVHVTHHPVQLHDERDGRSRIGRALPDLRMHLFDDRQRPVPDGVPGEIYVGGDGVALGYAGAPRQTAERFVPDGTLSGARLYRSGDVARRLPGGDAEYLGRADAQVKIRGFRAEPEEVRHCLVRQPGVRDAVVRAVADAVGDLALVAYVLPADPAIDTGALREVLREELPDHLVPYAVISVPAFPLTANGKIDLKALPAPFPRRTEAVVRPHTWEQEVVADAWRVVLGVREVSVQDNFFTLGGDSIKALRLAARLRRLGFTVSTESIYLSPTVAELCRSLPAGDRVAPPPDVPAAAKELSAWPGAVDAYPATQLQLGMLFHAAEASGPAPYHNASVTLLRDAFDEGRLRAAVAVVMARHAALRTAFDLQAPGVPMQVVLGTVDSPLTVERPSGLPESERRGRVERHIAAEKLRYFDVRRAPLVRFHALVLGEDLWALGLTEHHAILDGWSVASLLSELCRLYVHGAAALPGAPVAGDGVARAYARLERDALEDPLQRDFWRDVLADYEPLRLPVRWTGAPEGGGDAVRHRRLRLDAALADRLRAVADDVPVPFKTVLLAAHLAVLAHLGSTRRPVTGLITHGRPEVEGGEQALGLFLNTLPLCLGPESLDWRAWLAAVYREEARLLPHRRFPLAAMRDPSGAPVQLTSAFNFTNFHVYDQLRREAAVEVEDVLAYESTSFDLLTDFSVIGAEGHVDLTLAYRPDRFADEQVDGFLHCYRRALERLAENPSALVSDDAVVADRLAPTDPGPDAPLDWPHVRALIDETLPGVAPDRICAVDGERHLTYAALARETRIASARLRRLAPDEASVAVVLDKSLEWLVALLASVHAGATYVPIDPSDPPERVVSIQRGVGARIRIGGEETEPIGAVALPLALPQAPAHPWPPADAVASDSLAYVLHTSGSTGRPKGVGLPHRALVNLLSWQRQELPLAGARILQYAPVAFDVSVQEVLTSLCAAGTLVIVRGAMRRDFQQVADLMAREQVECLFAPDTVIKALWMAREPHPALRAVVSAGEALAMDDALARFVDAGGELHNHYGPTETHVVTAARVPAGSVAAGGDVPIGRPIRGTEILIVDPWMRPLPPGAVGEALISSPNVARGYHGAPRLTAERFLPHPGGRSGERVYRTGDLVFREPDGTLRFRGRRDGQVKVRGHRIELEEVRHALLRHPGVAQCAVLVQAGASGKSLLAYVALAEAYETEDVRAFAARFLPAFMVPGRIVRVDAIPTTANGKVDWRGLAHLASARADDGGRLEPEGPVESALLAAWCDVLQRADFPAGADFLEAGGTSIALLQLQLRIRARLGVEVSIAELALNSSFDRMARGLESRLGEAGAPPAF